ncbi:MAG: PASTA domain-containing protein, partial [Blastocatellia bacterium]
MKLNKGEVMKTYSRIIIGLLILTTSFWAMVVTAQERTTRQSATTINQKPSAVSQTRKVATVTPTPTPTPKSKFKLPTKISVESRLPDVFNNRDQQKQDDPRMPGLTGVEVRKAESTVRQIQPNARISVREGQYTNNFGPGIVIYHTPERGAFLKPGTEVVLHYNPQPGPTIPNLRGVDVTVAERILRRPFPNLAIRRVSVGDTSVQPNTVTRHTPATGQPYNAGTEVTLYFRPADPPPTPTVLVPDVQRMFVIDARRRLYQDNLGAGLPRGNFDNYIVTGQSPEAGERVPVRSIVALTVRPSVTVPDVTRRTLDDARQLLGQARLNVGSVSRRQSTAVANEVLSQNPAPGNVVVEGTSVNLVIATQPRVRVPDVQNQPRSTAAQRITDARLVVGQIETRESPAADGTVIGQTPPAGTFVVVGSQVNLTVAIPQTVQVPFLRGRSRDAAVQMITDARLSVGQVTTQESSAAQGTVLGQNPLPGARVPVG